MAGKSTFLRQNALLAVLAQAGCPVPARRLRLGVVDRLFSRVGAGDDLARGRSTFMAEMVETAAILTQATPRSLVILDEIGRGTATWDGLAIAWACAEALHETNRCRGLFATHYHELAELERRLPGVANLSMRAREWNGELVFLHEAGPGPADRSYGVQVARLAGVPAAVVARAHEVLARLEREAGAPAQLGDLPLFAAQAPGLAEPSGPSPVDSALADMDPDSMSPREALEALYRLKGLASPG
jgi:DNA mismatch repair protein MutS